MEEVRIDLPATLEALSGAVPRIRAFFEKVPGAGDDAKWLYGVELIASELLTNIVRHAYGGKGGDMRFEAEVGGEAVVLRFTDWGRSFDPDTVPEPDFANPEPGGRGLFLVRSYARRLAYSSSGERNTMTVEVALP